jgi:hypothetical protein
MIKDYIPNLQRGNNILNNDEQSPKQKPLIIHGGAPITSQKQMQKYNKKIPVLIPFDMIPKNKKIEWQKWFNYLFIDSGAFSVSQNNASINLKKYINFIKDNEDKISNYASLDVVGDGETSLHNWKVMRKAGLLPIPVFHDGENFDILKEYTDNCSYIGLGAVAYKSNKSRVIFFDKVFSMFPDRTKVGFHGFGVMDLGLLQRYPWKSIDSSSVTTIARFGGIIIGNKLLKLAISKRVNQESVRKWHSEYNEQYVKNEFIKYGRNYELAREGTQDGLFERQFFNLDTVNEYAKIPNVFNPILRVNTLF